MTTWLDRARALAGTDASLSPYLDMVDVIPPDRLSENRDALFDIRPAQLAQRDRSRCGARSCATAPVPTRFAPISTSL